MSTSEDRRIASLKAEVGLLRLLHRFGWLRTRDIACAMAGKTARHAPRREPTFLCPLPIASELRMAQRMLAKLRARNLVLTAKAPTGATLYALSEKGASALRSLSVNAASGKDIVKRFHAAFFEHRNVANQIALSSFIEGFRYSTEREVASGRWLGGMQGCNGKKPDVLISIGNAYWWVEVERSRKNRKDYANLMRWLTETAWSEEVTILGRTIQLKKVVFVCTAAFEKRLRDDLVHGGWTSNQLDARVKFETSLYSFQGIYFF